MSIQRSFETKRGRYFTINLSSGGQVKLSHFKVSERIRIEFYRDSNKRLLSYFERQHVSGKVFKIGETGFLTKSPRTLKQFSETVTFISSL